VKSTALPANLGVEVLFHDSGVLNGKKVENPWIKSFDIALSFKTVSFFDHLFPVFRKLVRCESATTSLFNLTLVVK